MTLKARYDSLATDRDQFLQRSYDAASLTIPTLIRDTVQDTIEDPYQSVGAEGVTNLASKILLALFPPGRPFFRFVPDPTRLNELIADQGPGVKASIEESLAAIERQLRSFVESNGLRPALYSCFQHLIVTGSPLLHIDKTGRARVIPLDRYVVDRDGLGTPVEIVTKETVRKDSLEGLGLQLETTHGTSVDVYTGLVREDDVYNVWQELANGQQIPKSSGKVSVDAPSHIPLRMFQVAGENYGRGLVELHIGDLAALEGLTQSLVEGAIAASRVIWLAKPGFGGNIRDLSVAPNGAYRVGDFDQVKALQLDKFADFRTVRDAITDLKTDLRAAFLMNRSVQRQAERVTAAEIRFMAQELEAGLGGAYSFLAEELQLPLVRRYANLAARADAIPDLDPDDVKPTIVTGIEGLGRSQEFEDARIFAQTLQEVFGPEGALQLLRTRDVAGILASSLGLDSSTLIKTEEELTAAQNRQTMAQLTDSLGPEVIRSIQNQQQQQ